MDGKDLAETGRTRAAIESLLPAIEKFTRFDGPDPAAREASRWKAVLDEPLPEKGAGLDRVLALLADPLIRNGLRNGNPGFNGWVTTGPTDSGIAAALAGTVAGSQRWWVQPFNHVETIALKWLAELLGLPASMQGVFVSGGSVANLMGIGAARQHAFERVGKDPARDGALSRARIYGTAEVHHAVIRAAGILGIGRKNVVAVEPAELARRLDQDVEDGIVPVAVVATAGTVSTGAVEPLEEMLRIAHERDVWFHVDGAYGLFGRLDPRVRDLYAGVEKADSVAADPHKWMAAPVGVGAAFVRDRALLGRAFTMEPADYLEGVPTRPDVQSPFDDYGDLYHDFSVEQSAPSRGVLVWAILKEIGADGMRERVTRHLDFARRLADRVAADERLELLAPPVLSICCFRYRAEGLSGAALDELNNGIVQRLRAETRFVPSTTRVDDKLAIRPCYINPRTTTAEVDGLAEAVRAIGDSIAARLTPRAVP